MWPFRPRPSDPRSRRVVFAIECLANQNARDAGAAESAAMTPGLLALLDDEAVGMAQIPCPEMICLGHRRDRPPGRSIREALGSPQAAACCARQAKAAADRIQDYREAGIEVLAVLGGNEQSPACAVHHGEWGELAGQSGLFMLALADELGRRGLAPPFCAVRDADAALLAQDLNQLRCLL